MEEFETRLFHQCLHLRARLLGWLVRRFRPHNFNSDYVFLRDAAMAKNSQELQAAITSYKLDCYRDSTFLHDTLKFRISCRKIKRIFTELASSKETIS